MASKNNYYAYLIPSKNKRGIVDNWKDCEKIVSGVVGARYRGFGTKEEAEQWLKLGADYGIKRVKKMGKGIYFDAGTGRGLGVEISVTDEKGKNLLHKVFSKTDLNKFGKHLISNSSATNNYGELLALRYALEIAKKSRLKKIFGDSRLVIDYWSQWRIKRNELPEETVVLANQVSKLRKEFEENGGKIKRISGDDNPADLGFHRG